MVTTEVAPGHPPRTKHLAAITLDDVTAEAGGWPLDPDLARDTATKAASEIVDALGSAAVPSELAGRVLERSRSFLAT